MNIESLFFLWDEEHAPQEDEGFFHINPLPSPLLLKADPAAAHKLAVAKVMYDM